MNSFGFRLTASLNRFQRVWILSKTPNEEILSEHYPKPNYNFNPGRLGFRLTFKCLATALGSRTVKFVIV